MKNPVGVVGEVTKEGKEAVQDMVDRIHGAFREHVAKAREGALVEALLQGENAKPDMMGGYAWGGGQLPRPTPSDERRSKGVMGVIDQVANGDVFLGTQALQLGLVDRLITSDEYIAERIRQGARVLKLVVHSKPMGLFRLLGHPSRPGNSPLVVGNIGTLGTLKKVARGIASMLITWAEPIKVKKDGFDSLSVPLDCCAIDDVQVHSFFESSVE